MMGIEILSQELIKEPYTWQVSIIVCSALLSVLFAIYGFAEDVLGYCIMAFICVGTCILTMGSVHVISHTYMEYKVLINSQTNVTEFYEKYEVIEQQGKIFTIREKENK